MQRKELINILKDLKSLENVNSIILFHHFLFSDNICSSDWERYFFYELNTWVNLCVPFIVIEFLEKIKGDEIHLSQEWNKLVIKHDDWFIKINCLNASDWIWLPLRDMPQATLTWNTLLWFLLETSSIVPMKYTPVSVACLKLVSDGTSVESVGTNTVAILYSKKEVYDIEYDIQIPKKYIKELFRLLPKMWTSNIYLDNSYVGIVWEWYKLLIPLIQGGYPNYKALNMFSEYSTQSISFNSKDFLDCIKLITIYTKDFLFFVELESIDWVLFFRDKDWLAQTSCVCTWDNIKIRFTSFALMNFLSRNDCIIKMQYNDSNSPIIFSPDNNSNYRCVIRPLS